MECVQVFILMTLCVATDIFHFDIESGNSGKVVTEDEIFGWHVGDVSLNSICHVDLQAKMLSPFLKVFFVKLISDSGS